jgi:predicted RNase H-like HicB family nuclease
VVRHEGAGGDQVDLGGRLVSSGDPRQPSPIQASEKAGTSDSCWKVIGRFGAWHVEQHFEAGWLKGPTLMRYAVVIEKAEGNYSAYVPDLPGCIATGDTIAAVEQEIREAIRFHIDGLKADGLPVPAPTSIAEYVET